MLRGESLYKTSISPKLEGTAGKHPEYTGITCTEMDKHLLHQAVWRKDVKWVEKLLQEMPEVDIAETSLEMRKHPINALGPQGHTALTLAIYMQHDACALLLIRAGSNGTCNNADGWTAFDESIST
eukprot:11113_1